jgi:hypothetical protein
MPVVAEVISGIAQPLFGLIDNLFTSDEEREKAKLALMQMEQQGKLEELKTNLSAILAEANSEDPYTSRARPTFLYVMYGCIGMCFLAAFAGIFAPHAVNTFAANLTMMLTAIPEEMWWLFGAGYLGYNASRSYDKKTFWNKK